MPVYRKTGRPLMEMNRGKRWRRWSRYPEMSADLLGMANYTWWCSAQSVDGSDCRDSLVISFRGSLEIHSVIEEENGALLSFWSLWGIIDKSRRNRAKEVLEEDPEAPRVTIRDDEEHDLEDHDMVEPQRPVDPPKEVSLKRKPAWACELIKDGEIWCPRRVSQGEQETSHVF